MALFGKVTDIITGVLRSVFGLRRVGSIGVSPDSRIDGRLAIGNSTDSTTAGARVTIDAQADNVVNLGSAITINWASGTSPLDFARDVGLKRSAAALLQVTDASSGTGNLRATRLITAEGAPASYATVGAQTYTAADILTGIIVRDCAGAGRTDTLPTAVLLVAAITGVAVGDRVVCRVVNGSDAAETITIAAGAGGGFDANQTAASRVIPQNTTKDLVIRFTNVTASSEAYTVYM